MGESKRVSWGVLGSAWINTLAIPGMLGAGNARLAAVSSRRSDTAEADRVRWGAERAYGSYNALLADRDIEAVYIPLPNHLHEEWTVKALRAGKHVLCEKPLALSLSEIDAIESASKQSGKAGDGSLHVSVRPALGARRRSHPKQHNWRSQARPRDAWLQAIL